MKHDHESASYHLTREDEDESEMAPLNPDITTTEHVGADEIDHVHDDQHVGHRVYKRRFFGLFQLILLNIIVSWDV